MSRSSPTLSPTGQNFAEKHRRSGSVKKQVVASVLVSEESINDADPKH